MSDMIWLSIACSILSISSLMQSVAIEKLKKRLIELEEILEYVCKSNVDKCDNK